MQKLSAYIDGGSRGNPGEAGIGVYFPGVVRIAEYLGTGTNNYAEYSGLIAALQYAVQHNCKALKVVSDSELMVRQVRGEYKVKNAVLQELHAQARALLRKLDWFEIEHVLREKNREADRLANTAMDTGRGKAGPQTASINAESANLKPLDGAKELNGIVRGGVIELLGDELPDGTIVPVLPDSKPEPLEVHMIYPFELSFSTLISAFFEVACKIIIENIARS